MIGFVTAAEREALLRGYQDALDDASAELSRRSVEADAADATALPGWWPFAAKAVLVLTIALSAALPWGWAS